METVKQGQIVKFHSPLADENPNQLYVVLEVTEENYRPRADIQALNTGLSFPPINTVKLEDLEVVEVDATELIGHKVTIIKSDFSKVDGRVIKIGEQKIQVNMSKENDGVKTNVWLTIIDNEGIEHIGTLFVN